MFKKKTKQTNLHTVNDSKTPSDAFRLRTTAIGWESFRPADYTTYHKLCEDEMIAKLDEHLDKLLSGEVDLGNSNLLDNYISSIAREALTDLVKQRFDHQDTIRRLLTVRNADKEDIRNIRTARDAEYRELRDELEKTCMMLKKYEEG